MERKPKPAVRTSRKGFRTLEIDDQKWFWKAYGGDKPVKIYDPAGKGHMVPVFLVGRIGYATCETCGDPGCRHDPEDLERIVVEPGKVADYIRNNLKGNK